MARLKGKNASATVNGGAVVGMGQWSTPGSVDALDSTGFETNGIRAYIDGLEDWTVSGSGHWDDTEAKLYGAPPALSPGAAITAFRGYIDSVKFYEITNMLCTQFSPSVDVQGQVDYTFEFKPTASSVVTYPTP